MAYNTALVNVVRQYLNSQHWHFQEEDKGDRFYFRFGMNLKCKLKSCRMIIDIKRHGILTYGVVEINADESSRDDVVEFITRANYGLIDGTFEFDHRDGEIRFRTFLRGEFQTPDIRDVEKSVDMPLLMLERYGNGLVKNIMGFGDPENDIKEIEG